jgi:hypothetical protein
MIRLPKHEATVYKSRAPSLTGKYIVLLVLGYSHGPKLDCSLHLYSKETVPRVMFAHSAKPGVLAMRLAHYVIVAHDRACYY